MNETQESSPSVWARHAKRTVRMLVLVLVAWGIWHTLIKAQADFVQHEFLLGQVDFRWVAVAGWCYLVGLTPCMFFWERTLRAMGQSPHWRQLVRAFWIGHLGKYVPGKAMVVVLRTALVCSPGVDATVAATSVFVETLSMMAVGACVASALLLVISRNWWLMLLAVGLMLGAGIPTLPPIFQRIVRLLQVQRANPAIDRAIDGLNYRLMATGWWSIGAGWFLLGLSLWATLQSMPGVSLRWSEFGGDWLLLTASVGLAVVAGFLSLIPGGLGVRDWILMTLLAPRFGPAVAVISTVLLRVTWLLAELLISGLLYADLWWTRRWARGVD